MEEKKQKNQTTKQHKTKHRFDSSQKQVKQTYVEEKPHECRLKTWSLTSQDRKQEDGGTPSAHDDRAELRPHEETLRFRPLSGTHSPPKPRREELGSAAGKKRLLFGGVWCLKAGYLVHLWPRPETGKFFLPADVSLRVK